MAVQEKDEFQTEVEDTVVGKGRKQIAWQVFFSYENLSRHFLIEARKRLFPSCSREKLG